MAHIQGGDGHANAHPFHCWSVLILLIVVSYVLNPPIIPMVLSFSPSPVSLLDIPLSRKWRHVSQRETLECKKPSKDTRLAMTFCTFCKTGRFWESGGHRFSGRLDGRKGHFLPVLSTLFRKARLGRGLLPGSHRR